MMKILIAAVFLAMLSTAGATYAEPVRKDAHPAQDAGRYEIVIAEYEAPGGVRGLYNRKVVIRVDTATGRTWALKEMTNKGIEASGTTKYWVEIEEYKGDKYPVIESAK